MKKMVFPFFFFFILFSVLAEEIHLKVNLTESAPMVFPDEDGNALGFYPEILNYIAGQEGWQLEYVQNTWPNSLKNLEEGKAIAAVANRFNLLSYGKQYNNIEKTPIVYSPVNLYFATTKGKNAHILKTIDEYIK